MAGNFESKVTDKEPLKIKIISRNYEWFCGDRCCSESRIQIEIFTDFDSLVFDSRGYFDYAPTSLADVLTCEKVRDFLCLVDGKPQFNEGNFAFDFSYTTDEFDD